MLQVKDITSGYGKILVLRDISIEVNQGEIVGVIGRNGVGKTTLLKTIAGNLPCNTGRITLGDVDITGYEDYERARSGIGYVPQGRGIFPDLTVEENVMVAAVALKKNADAVKDMLELFPAIKAKKREKGRNLSGGQQQILALARALVQQPKVLLLDEPTEGIQPSIVSEIRQSLEKLREKSDIGVVLVEQNLDFIKKLASRTYLLDSDGIKREISAEDWEKEERWVSEMLGDAVSTD